MSELNDDIARGCLENGEAIEARWGGGPWSEVPEQQQEPEMEHGQCPYCGGNAWYFGGEFVECEKCDHLDELDEFNNA